MKIWVHINFSSSLLLWKKKLGKKSTGDRPLLLMRKKKGNSVFETKMCLLI